jgi:phosphatidate cytidylyltransferase
MHRLRVLSALLLIPPFLLLVQFGSPLQFNLVVSVATLLCAWEFAWLCPLGADLWVATLTVVGSLLWQAAMLGALPASLLPPLVVGVALAGSLARGGELRTGVLQAAWVALGIFYPGGLFGCGSLLRGERDGRQLVYFLVFTTWAGDIGAYYVGSRWGRRPLLPRVSPKKTVEGSLGGIAATALVAGLGSGWLWPRLPIGTAALVGVVLAIVGMVGDLSESAVKRAANVKDSGSIIPGHGGVLDRLDSLLFATPFLYGLAWLGWV